MDVIRLYFMRHGDAGDPTAYAGPDSERPLSSKGRSRTRHMATHLKHMGLKPGLILTSPLVRAHETATLLAKGLECDDIVSIDPRVGPGMDETAVRSILAEFGAVGEIVLVGHEPDFSTTIGELIGGGAVTVKKGAIARVDISRPRIPDGSLVWLLTPATV